MVAVAVLGTTVSVSVDGRASLVVVAVVTVATLMLLGLLLRVDRESPEHATWTKAYALIVFMVLLFVGVAGWFYNSCQQAFAGYGE